MATTVKSLCLFFLLLLVSSSLFISEARPLNDAPSRNPINKGIEILFDGLDIQAIKTGGPSAGGKGHEFTDAQTLGVTKSGPSPGEGH
ncbi:hypothetical protein Pint_08706 [Pistacia integerrima]|uniref:Uncharacterized protein n=1 Tax=Pistacia integerrima TaxID=434235 RepID=A0ACC0XXC1_9ROSI|nr:hypothetical protein Pint_08706 [Pistacia integerrima]